MVNSLSWVNFSKSSLTSSIFVEIDLAALIVNLKQEVLDIAAKHPMLGIKLLIIDTERKFIASGFGKELAEAAQGKYVQLPKATEKAIAAMALNAINEF